MPSPLPATSPSSRGTVLIAALAGRALAAAARRAGYAALVADLFCDLDTQALAVRTARLPGDLSARHRRRGVAAGSAHLCRKDAACGRRARLRLRAAARPRRRHRCRAAARRQLRRGDPPAQGSAPLRRRLRGARNCRIRRSAQPHPPIRRAGWSSRRAGRRHAYPPRARPRQRGGPGRLFPAPYGGTQPVGTVRGRRPYGQHCRLQQPVDGAGAQGAVPLWRRGAAAPRAAAACGGDRRGTDRAHRPGRPAWPRQRRLSLRRRRLPADRGQSAARRHARPVRFPRGAASRRPYPRRPRPAVPAAALCRFDGRDGRLCRGADRPLSGARLARLDRRPPNRRQCARRGRPGVHDLCPGRQRRRKRNGR